MKTACFRFEASSLIGAGHAIRSCVIADALVDLGWICNIITSLRSYDFISALKRFERIDPIGFETRPIKCDLLVVDSYELDCSYESNFRQDADKILVIDDLANRRHNCDILVDQACGRMPFDYQKYVPDSCKLLLGSNYAMLRKEFRQLRPDALKKRLNTDEIRRVFISFGGGDQSNFIVSALKMLQHINFKGEIDIAMGFTNAHTNMITDFINHMPNKCNLLVASDMAQVMYDADIAIGGAGSTVWERACLGLPSILLQTAINQSFFLSKIADFNIILTDQHDMHGFQKAFTSIAEDYNHYVQQAYNKVDAYGVHRIIEQI